MSTPTSEHIARALLAEVRAAHPRATGATLARAVRAAWREGCDHLGDALEGATAEALAAERARAAVQAARAEWVNAWPALLDLAERAEVERRAA